MLAALMLALGGAFLVGRAAVPVTDAFFRDAPDRRLDDADLAAIPGRIDDAKRNRHHLLQLGVHNGVMVVDEHFCGDICPDDTVSIVHYAVAPGPACEKAGGVAVAKPVPAAASIGTRSFCLPLPLAVAQCDAAVAQWREAAKSGPAGVQPNCRRALLGKPAGGGAEIR